MRRFTTFLSLLFLAGAAQAQSDTGLIAHWPMSGNAYDSSGNGHDGTMTNLTPATGRNGIAGSALFFSGDGGSAIRVPNDAGLDLDSYSICATVMPTAFYLGKCSGNDIINRGGHYADGHYGLFFFDNPYDDDCDNVDSNHFVFGNEASGNLPLVDQWQYEPNIHTNNWYSVVATYKEGTYSIWVDGELKSMPTVSSPWEIGTSSDGITIGRIDWGDTATYPYPFTGVIDDIKIYNRVLTAREVQQYNKSTSLAAGDVAVNQPQEQAYPNPTTGIAYVRPELVDNERAELAVSNAAGQIVSRLAVTGNKPAKIDLSAQPAGMYHWRCVGRDGRIRSGKISVVR